MYHDHHWITHFPTTLMWQEVYFSFGAIYVPGNDTIMASGLLQRIKFSVRCSIVVGVEEGVKENFWHEYTRNHAARVHHRVLPRDTNKSIQNTPWGTLNPPKYICKSPTIIVPQCPCHLEVNFYLKIHLCTQPKKTVKPFLGKTTCNPSINGFISDSLSLIVPNGCFT